MLLPMPQVGIEKKTDSWQLRVLTTLRNTTCQSMHGNRLGIAVARRLVVAYDVFWPLTIHKQDSLSCLQSGQDLLVSTSRKNTMVNFLHEQQHVALFNIKGYIDIPLVYSSICGSRSVAQR